jgi:uncharacterized protein (TIGR04255 family)
MAGNRRTHPPLRLEDSPLVLVLGVVRISPILLMEKYIPQIQEELRTQFPRLKKSEIKQFHFGPELQVESAKKWTFTDRAERTAVSITQNSVSLQTTAYGMFDDFIEQLTRAVTVAGRNAGIAEFDRLGLRYIDLIRPVPGQEASEFLSPALRSLRPADFGALEMWQRHEFVSKTSEGVLVVRTSEQTGQTPLPPDLGGSDLPMKPLPSPGDRVVLLDIDHFSEGARDFDVPAISEAFWRLHDYCDIAFRTATTEDARRSVWGGVDLPDTPRSA